MLIYIISSNIFQRKAQFALCTIIGNFIISIHRIACLKRNFTFLHVLQTCGAMFHWLSGLSLHFIWIKWKQTNKMYNVNNRCSYIFEREIVTHHKPALQSPYSLWESNISPARSACLREEAGQDRSWSVSSGVGSGPWPSDDVDLGFIIQLLHDSLLFDRQDGVADWTTTLRENMMTL